VVEHAVAEDALEGYGVGFGQGGEFGEGDWGIEGDGGSDVEAGYVVNCEGGGVLKGSVWRHDSGARYSIQIWGIVEDSWRQKWTFDIVTKDFNPGS
jgi:hypothetical protein